MTQEAEAEAEAEAEGKRKLSSRSEMEAEAEGKQKPFASTSLICSFTCQDDFDLALRKSACESSFQLDFCSGSSWIEN